MMTRRDPFPTTRWSLLIQMDSEDPDEQAEALREVCERYWYPLYGYVRSRGVSVEDAEDATQGFFEQLLRNESFRRMGGGEKGRMRTYLMCGMQNWLAKEHRRRTAKKRGGPVMVTMEGAEERLQAEPFHEETPEVLYERRWAEALLLAAHERLRADYESAGKGEVFRLLAPQIVRAVTGVPMAELAEALGLKEGHVRVMLHRLRKQMRVTLEEEVALTVRTPEELETELAHLFEILTR